MQMIKPMNDGSFYFYGSKVHHIKPVVNSIGLVENHVFTWNEESGEYVMVQELPEEDLEGINAYLLLTQSNPMIYDHLSSIN